MCGPSRSLRQAAVYCVYICARAAAAGRCKVMMRSMDDNIILRLWPKTTRRYADNDSAATTAANAARRPRCSVSIGVVYSDLRRTNLSVSDFTQLLAASYSPRSLKRHEATLRVCFGQLVCLSAQLCRNFCLPQEQWQIGWKWK